MILRVYCPRSYVIINRGNIWRDDRVVEGNGLENRRAGNGTVGSNPTLSAKIENRNRKPKWGRHEVPTQMYSPQKILNLKGFATLRVAQKVRFDL